MTLTTFKNKLEEQLDELFPKGKCKERGEALVLLAHAIMLFKENYYETEKSLNENTEEEINEMF